MSQLMHTHAVGVYSLVGLVPDPISCLFHSSWHNPPSRTKIISDRDFTRVDNILAV